MPLQFLILMYLLCKTFELIQRCTVNLNYMNDKYKKYEKVIIKYLVLILLPCFTQTTFSQNPIDRVTRQTIKISRFYKSRLTDIDSEIAGLRGESQSRSHNSWRCQFTLFITSKDDFQSQANYNSALVPEMQLLRKKRFLYKTVVYLLDVHGSEGKNSRSGEPYPYC